MKIWKNNELKCRVGLEQDATKDYWLHAGFYYDRAQQEVVVDYWSITDFAGKRVLLHELKHDKLVFVIQALQEEVDYIKANKYEQMEQEYMDAGSQRFLTQDGE